MSYLQLGMFFGVSFVAAAINSVAGGGTFLTFPVFILNGLTALQANIMSTIALWPGTLASVYGYRSVLQSDRREWVVFLVVGILGSIVGVGLLLSTPEVIFKHLVPWLLLSATLIFTFGRYGIALLHKNPSMRNGHRYLSLFIQIVIGVYGGYFGAGMGILTLAMLQILGMSDIHRMNALKTLLTGTINAVAALIFVFSGKVIWSLALVMVTGAILGGYSGARLSLIVPPEKIRLLVSGIGFAMSAYFFLHS